jgi:hypothetical protein
MPISDLPNLYLLDAGGPQLPTVGLPRDALTFIAVGGRRHCLTPLGRTGSVPATAYAPAMPTVCVCNECHDALLRDKIPARSLVRVDAGPWPADAEGPLPQLTPVEVQLVTPVSVSRRVVVVRPPGGETRPAHTLQKVLRGHIVVSPSVSPQAMATVLPRDLNDIPNDLMVSKCWIRNSQGVDPIQCGVHWACCPDEQGQFRSPV